MVHEIEAPLFYVVKRGLSPEEIDAVRASLSITPCQAVFISKTEDHDLAWRFSDQVMMAVDEETALLLAKRWATDIGRPMLVVGTAALLDAVFADGKREALTIHAAS